MADTQRTLAEILILLADNASGNISAQDIRDAVVTVKTDHGSMYITASAATSIATQNVWYDVSGTWGILTTDENFSMDTNGRLQFDGAAERHVHVTATLSAMTATVNETYEFGLAKNGTIITSSIARQKINATTDVKAISMMGVTAMETGDYLTLQVRNTTDDTNPTVVLAMMMAVGFQK